jgi:hypothetical protein
VRFDLNYHTDALNALRGEQMSKEKAIEFVFKEMLKLKPPLELDLFQQSFEPKQNVRIEIMLDPFNEITSSNKKTAIDLLQELRQTAVEHMWVTTRSYLREELEENLLQLPT